MDLERGQPNHYDTEIDDLADIFITEWWLFGRPIIKI